MGRASSSKKVARAASTGGGRTARGARPVVWYAAIAVVVLLGVSGIVFSRAERREELALGADPSSPVPGIDHWHNAYGFFLCDEFSAPVADVSGGIHTHNDGLIHIEPLTRREGGRNSTLERFLDAAGIEVTDTSIEVPGRDAFVEGETKCDGKDGVVQLQVNDDPPITTGIATRKFVEGDVLTIAFAPEGASIPKPPSEASLAEQLGTSGPMPDGTAGSTVPPVAEGEGATTTVAPAEGDTSTTTPAP